MKRLFKIVHPVNGKVEYFEDKVDAKARRDELNRDLVALVVLRRGPDHWRGETE